MIISVGLTPVILIYLFVLDLVFILNTSVFMTISDLFKLVGVDISCLPRTIDKSYETLFDMEKLDVAGFRRQRTIAQLMFEGVI